MNFLNDSLKTLKTVLAEGLDQSAAEFDDSSSSSKGLVDVNTKEQIANLTRLCHHQSEEIEILRKQNFEYQQSRLSDISHSSKTLTEENAQKQQQPLAHNESWFWEQETSSTSSKRDGNGSTPEEIDVDLTTVPLDSNDQETAEKLRRQIVERDKTLKLLSAENAELNEKLKNSFKENQELERNIEELDQQHQIAIEKVLDVKKGVQEKLTKSLEEKEELKKESHEKLEKISSEKNEVENQLKQITEITKKYEEQIEKLNEVNLTLETEISEFKNSLKATSSHEDCLKKINMLVNTNFNLNETFVSESSFMENFSKFLTKISFELSALADENKLIKDEIGKYANERDKLKSELINYEIECSELVKNNNILMADIETLRGRKLETIMENEDEENMVATDAIDTGVVDSNQDDFNSIRTKLDETEAERTEYYEEVHQLKREIAEHVTKCKMFQEEIENLENEKSNYLFELNELKSEEERNFLQREVKTYKERELELSSKVDIFEKENVELKKKLDQLETTRGADANEELQDNLEKLKNIRNEADLLEKNNGELKFELNALKTELEELKNEKENLVFKSEELRKTSDSNLENMKKTTEIVQELQQRLLETQSNEKLILSLQDELNNLKSQNEILESEARKSSNTHQELLNQLEILQESESQSSQLSEKVLNLENELSKLSEENRKLSEYYQQSQKLNEEISEKMRISEDIIKEINSSKTSESAQASEDIQSEVSQLKDLSSRLTQEKEELIGLLTTKHNENVQYHNEIIRLTQLYQQETQKIQSMTDENIQIRAKLESFAETILYEQNNNRLFMQEKNDLLEQNNLLNKDIERLRQHLLEVADAYTFEQVSLQKQVEDYKSKYIEIGNEVKKSATAFTSANIRANQQAETLQTQYNLLLQQRDDLLTKLSAAEDKDNKNQAALTNLQVALEIFQKDKERDIDMRTTSLQRELHEEHEKQMKLKNEIQQLNLQLQEAKNGLMAATRLSDQLELNQLTIDRLNNDIKSYQQVNDSLRKKLEESNANLSNADIDLIKNLVIGYLSAPNSNAKTQILKLISNVLHLSDAECIKIGLKSAGLGAWFSQGSNDTVNNNRSLTEAFVAFLEKESEPRVNATNLLTIHETETNSAVTRKSSTTSNPPQELPTTNPQEQAETSSSVTLNLNDNALLTPYSNRNSSSILKDLLHDT